MPLASNSIPSASVVLIVERSLDQEHSTLKMVYLTVKQIGMTCSQPNVLVVGSQLRQEIGGSRLLTITTTASVSNARNVTRTWRVRASSPRVESPSARHTPNVDFKFLRTTHSLFHDYKQLSWVTYDPYRERKRPMP